MILIVQAALHYFELTKSKLEDKVIVNVGSWPAVGLSSIKYLVDQVRVK